MSWVLVDPDAAHDHVEYTGLVVPGAMTSSTPKKDHPSTFFECHLIATGRVSTSANKMGNDISNSADPHYKTFGIDDVADGWFCTSPKRVRHSHPKTDRFPHESTEDPCGNPLAFLMA